MNIIITSGGTSEKIDNVRRITNSSSGKLGSLIANEFINQKYDLIDNIFYICDKKAIKPLSNKKIKIIEVSDTISLYNTVIDLLTKEKIDYFIHSMAVSDYRVDYITTARKLSKHIENNNNNILSSIINCSDILTDNKISSNEEDVIIKLKKNPKVIYCIKEKSPNTFLVGFKLLDGVSKDELINTAIKLKDKNKCDLVVCNDLKSIRNNNHIAYIVKSDNTYIESIGKESIAKELIKQIFKKSIDF